MDIKIVLILVLLLSIMVVALPILIIYLKDNKKNQPKLKDCKIKHELEFGGVYLEIKIEDFNKLGFQYGDSVNVYFSNGYKLRNIPYYNGYYTQTGNSLLIGYPGYEYLKIAINNGDDLWNLANLYLNRLSDENNLLWDTFNLDEDITATVTLAQKRKYIDIQEARDIHYFDERSMYENDEIFANFRVLTGGLLRDKYFYRSASPCDNQHKRAAYVDKLIEKAGIKFVINLADDDTKIQSYMKAKDYNSKYFSTLYNKEDIKNDFVEPLALNMNYSSKYFKERTIKALSAILNNDGPFLIHCTEGKDRTGFICMLIEALAGATYDEIVMDYMITYENYYFMTKESSKYKVIVENVLNPMVKAICGKRVNIKNANLQTQAKKYLYKIGMPTESIDKLISKLIAGNEG